MCGISGIIKNQTPSHLIELEELSRKFHSKRGPDNFGIWKDEVTFFTHSRLSIIELSEAGNQPMLSKSGNSVITFNGEIYNFKEIARELGVQSTSDTEVILESYEKFGIEKTLEKLNGMFAFCLYDQQKKKHFFARDRFGQKPLYFSRLNNAYYFASDIRILSQLLRPQLSLNKDALSYYLRELSVPQPYSIWNEIEQVKPGHYLSLENDQITEIKYWSIPTKIETYSETEALDIIENKLQNAIENRLISDVPVGSFLSGGVDSGLIVSLLRSKSNKDLNTFSVGFDFAAYNELEDAKIIANKYETNHTEITISTDIKNDIENILALYGEPFADSSAIPTYYISKETKKHVTVALSGDGGDEMFGGYLDYATCFEAEQYAKENQNKILRQGKTMASKITSRLGLGTNKGSLEEYLKLGGPIQLSRNMGFSAKEQFVANEYDFMANYWREIWDDNASGSMTQQLMTSSLKTRLLNDYLVKVDRASMANSLEVRSPFLDHHLAEFAFSLAPELKFKNGHSKYLLKKLGEKYMYEDIFSRKKRGFEIPIKNWLKNELFDFAANNIEGLEKRQLFNSNNLMSLLHQHKKGVSDNTHRLWALIALEIWFKSFYD